MNLKNMVIERLARFLPAVLKGKLPALELLFPTEPELQQYSMENYYNNCSGNYERCTLTVKSVFDTFYATSRNFSSNDSGKVRVLEVGSGTGFFTAILLTQLRERHGENFEFYYTDISANFFAQAENRFAAYARSLKYIVFDLEKSPLGQGIPLEYFDVVAGFEVVHATKSLYTSLHHIKQVLRPGGLVMLGELIKPRPDVTFVFGLLESYWRFEDTNVRQYHCCVSEQVWKDLFVRNGFGSFNCVNYGSSATLVALAKTGDRLNEVVYEPEEFQQKAKACNRKQWLVFGEYEDSDSLEALEYVAATLAQAGNQVTVLLRQDDNSEKLDQETGNQKPYNVCWISGDDSQTYEKLLNGANPVEGIIFAWGINGQKNLRETTLPLLLLAQAVVSLEVMPTLLVVTRGVQPVTEESLVFNPGTATLGSMLKTVKNSFPGLECRHMDVAHYCSSEHLKTKILFELAMLNSGTQLTKSEQTRLSIAYSPDGTRYESKLAETTLADQQVGIPASSKYYCMVLPKSRLVQDIQFRAAGPQPMESEEVEVKVVAYSLNFRDVLTVLKPSKDFEVINQIGLDYAGVVTRVDGNCKRVKVGDRVFGGNHQETQLFSHLLVPKETAILHIPENMTYLEAATIPMVFTTVIYCLCNVAKLKKGETVLIHTASGGVGLAAIQLAQNVIGAKIICTAGTKRKRLYLRKLGMTHVFHSRDTSYEQKIMEVTEGKGVNVVLNSITGPGFKEATLRVTARNGRFIEMSKLTIWSSEEVKAVRPDVSYDIVDVRILPKQTQRQAMSQIQELMLAGKIKPLPFTRFDAGYVRHAMQYLQNATHIGKVMVSMPEQVSIDGHLQLKLGLFNAESSYLITGGLDGVGFEVCKWMIGLGATNLVIVGRRPPKKPIQKQIDGLRSNRHVKIVVKQVDVGCTEQCTNLIEYIKKHEKPLRGVMHCAGVLRDNLFVNQTWYQFEQVYNPKVYGTENLHRETLSCPLEHFVVFSSIASLVGSPVQANHTSASAFEDAFIHYRHSLGLPGTTVNWGQWAEAGVVKNSNVVSLVAVSTARMLNGLELTLRSQRRHVAVCEFDTYQTVMRRFPGMKAYLETLNKADKTGSGSGPAGHLTHDLDELRKNLNAEGAGKSEKTEIIAKYLKDIIRYVLRLEDELTDDTSIPNLGIDSLMAIELTNFIKKLVGPRVKLTNSLFQEYSTIGRMAAGLVDLTLQQGGPEAEAIALTPLSVPEMYDLLLTDSKLSEGITEAANFKNGPCRASEIKKVLVTGATGRLGSNIIAELVKSYPKVEKIYCLVRYSEEAQGFERLQKAFAILPGTVDTSKITCFVGDITESNLGLESEQTYLQLCEEVDAVIHCAAKVHYTEHLRKYSTKANGKIIDTRSVNTLGFINILKLVCTQRVKHVYFPSLVFCGLIQNTDESHLGEDWHGVDVFEPLCDGLVPGIFSSKFVCELLLRQLVEQGFPCKVFRLPWLAGNSETGKVNPEKNMFIFRYLSFLKLGVFPDIFIPALMMPVDLAAVWSLKVFMNDVAPSDVYNITHPNPGHDREFVKVAEREFGLKLELVEWYVFAELLLDKSNRNEELDDLYRDHRLISNYIGLAVQYMAGFTKNQEQFFYSRKVNKFIPNVGNDILGSMEYIAKTMRYLKDMDFLKRFGIEIEKDGYSKE